MGAKWRTTRHKPGAFFKAQRLAISTVSPLFTCLGFTLDMVCIGIMHCVDLGVTQAVLGNIFADYLDKGSLPDLSPKDKVCDCGFHGRHGFVPTNIWCSILEWHNDMLDMQSRIW